MLLDKLSITKLIIRSNELNVSFIILLEFLSNLFGEVACNFVY